MSVTDQREVHGTLSLPDEPLATGEFWGESSLGFRHVLIGEPVRLQQTAPNPYSYRQPWLNSVDYKPKRQNVSNGFVGMDEGVNKVGRVRETRIYDTHV